MSREREIEREGESLFGTISAAIALRKSSPRVLLVDIATAIVALVFVRAPLLFGAHPLAAALLAVLPERVIAALIGTLIGAITLGDGGVVYAMTALIIVFLRIIISSSAKRGSPVFGEGLLLRASVAVIGGFAVAVYEILLRGFDMTSVLFGITMVLAPPIIALLLSGLFEYGDTTLRMITTGSAILRGRGDGKALYFKLSSLVFLFLVSFALREYSALGISADYLLAAFVTLFCARSLGAVHGAAVGFVMSLASSGSYAAGFMLAGALAGALSQLGAVYASIFGGVALGIFSAYVGGAMGIASTLPEYAAAAALSYPILKKISAPAADTDAADTERSALDMIGTMALSYKSTHKRGVGSVAPTFGSLSFAIRDFLSKEPSVDELSIIVYGIVKQRASSAENDENIRKISTKLYNKEKISPSDLAYLKLDDNECYMLCEEIKRTCERIVVPSVPTAQELSLTSKLLREISARDEAEIAMNDAATDSLEKKLSELGFGDFTARVLGSRRHIILAGRDPDGTVITSAQLHAALSEGIGAPLSTPEYFRRGGMALMECSEAAQYSVSYATVGTVCRGSEISGDISRKIETSDRFYALISDGMGTGAVARRHSEFVASYLSALLPIAALSDTVVHLLNAYLLRGEEERSATLDLFELDLYNKEAVFVKSGGAPSYVKRGSSIFRIRSTTAPLGIMSNIDSERIRVQIERGDYVIMTSDGAHGIPEDAPWLLELIAAVTPKGARELADAILSAAIKHRKNEDDDVTVTVLRID